MAVRLPQSVASARQWRLGRILVVALALLAGAALYATNGRQASARPLGPPSLTAPPTGKAFGAEIHHFDDIATMTATADVVVRARVSEVKRGTPEYDPNDPERKLVLWPRVVTLTVEEVLFDKTASAPATISVYEGHWSPTGDGYAGIEHEGLRWSKPGERGFYFLKNFAKDRTQGATYNLISSQGRALVGAVGLEPAKLHDELTEGVGRMSAGALELAVRKAATGYRTGAVKPQSAGRGPGR